MNVKSFCDNIMRLYLYADMTKMIHYDIESGYGHELCDSTRDIITDYADKIAEIYFGYYGKPKFTDFKINVNVYTENDLGKLLGRVSDIVIAIKKDVTDITKLSGLISTIDDFIADISQKVFQCNFDKVSAYKLEEK